MIRYIPIWLLSAILTACAVGPNYHQPKEELAPFHNTPAAGASVDRTSLDQWWTGFNDPMLTEVVQRALSQNLDLAASIARVRQARAAASGAGAALLPSADLDASATYERQSTRGALGSIASTVPGYSQRHPRLQRGTRGKLGDRFVRRSAARGRGSPSRGPSRRSGPGGHSDHRGCRCGRCLSAGSRLPGPVGGRAAADRR